MRRSELLRRTALVEKMLDEARADVGRADQKASLLLAALGVGFSVILGSQLAGDFDPWAGTCWSIIAWSIGAVLALASVASSALAVWPRYVLRGDLQNGATYWGHIAGYRTLREFDAALERLQPTTLERSSHQLWRLSRIVLLKYRYVRISIAASAGAAATLLLSSVI